jgi:hypothetical protein
LSASARTASSFGEPHGCSTVDGTAHRISLPSLGEAGQRQRRDVRAGTHPARRLPDDRRGSRIRRDAARQEGYEPLVGYTVLELAGAVVDRVSHRLVARKYYDLKAVGARPASALRDRDAAADV